MSAFTSRHRARQLLVPISLIATGAFVLGSVVTLVFLALQREEFRGATLPPHGLFPADVSAGYPGITRLKTCAAAQSPLAPDEEVVGVCADGHCRAYRLSSLAEGPQTHIVNDVLGRVPVSVTHCPMSNCTHVYTGQGSGPLPVGQGGLMPGGMVITARGLPYQHLTGAPLHPGEPPFPYTEHPWTVMSWAQWVEAHPATDVYLGPEMDNPDQ